jgi:tRNA(Ile)-lysidine synthase
MALCHILSSLREKLKLRLLILSVDHGLRPEARDEVGLVEAFCQKEDLEFRGLTLRLSGGSNLQERAREARYEILRRHAHEHFGEDSFLVTAHHKEDRAETVLLRLLRGTSLEGLNVLPPRSGLLLRPMVEAARSDVEAHLERHHLSFCSDPSNIDRRFLRVRVRTELIPLLQSMSPGAIEHLANLAEEAADLDAPLGLNREQRSQIRRALKDKAARVDLPLPGGLRLFRD